MGCPSLKCMADALRLVATPPEEKRSDVRPSGFFEPDHERVSEQLENESAEVIVAWAAATFGDGLILSSSFGAESALMLHLVTRVAPKVPVVFLDTGYLFPETYRFA